MKKYIETLGNIIEGQVPEHPDRARALLATAYSWIRFSAKHSKYDDVRSAYNRLNGSLAGTIVDSFRQPQDAVMVNLFMPCEMLHALGLQPMFPEGISAYLACTGCQKIFAEQAEAGDVPDSFCSYHKIMIGLAETEVMPKPLMIANTTLACDANQLSFRRLADYYQIPHTVIDVPYEISGNSVQYVADQLRQLGSQLEDYSHRTLDLEILKERIACSKRTLEYYRAFFPRRGDITIPATMTGELCSLVATHVMLGRPEAEYYAKELLYHANKAPWKNDSKKRIFWCHTLPNWQDSMINILEQSGKCEIVGSDLSADWLDNLNPDKPYESMARRVIESICNGPAERRIDKIIHQAKLVKADGIILFCHWGCKQTMGMSQLAKRAFEENGFPTLVLDGDGCDSRNVADGQMVTRVNAFIEQLEGWKK